MLGIIGTVIEWYFDEYSDDNYMLHKDCAHRLNKHILDTVEEYGMLPPADHPIWKRHWEPEDEA